MTVTLHAVYDGKVLFPDRPLDLKPNTHVKLILEEEAPGEEARSFFKTARSLNLKGPSDWSSR
ncbi:MAG: antitoxin family protein [Deltaproteobacteria bacterium]|nr:antitoxin family protein [Deltaproteobacteria bacterium]